MRSLAATAVLLVVHLVAAEDPRPAGTAEVKLSAEEKELLDLLNKARKQDKLPPLAVDPLLCKAARLHSENMARQETMAHKLDGKGVGDRVTAAGYEWRVVRENLGVDKLEDERDAPPSPPAKIHEGWMNSKGHRANILHPKVTQVGLSRVRSKKGNVYYTQVFALPDR